MCSFGKLSSFVIHLYSFFKENKEIYLDIVECADELNEACKNGDKIEIKKAYNAMHRNMCSRPN